MYKARKCIILSWGRITIKMTLFTESRNREQLSFQEKCYDPSSNRLFLVYYALDDSLNLNGWRVSAESIERNIRSFVGKPAVLKPKDQFDPSDRNQTGRFVHPILHNASLDENLSYQERYAVGRINNVSRNNKCWRFDVEITDPEMKQALKSNDADVSSFTDNQYPRWVSPQIATFPDSFLNESENNIQHWHGLHLAFVDIPAYGFAKSDMAGKCYGSEQVCTAQLRSASADAEQRKKEYEEAMKLLRQEQAQAAQELSQAQKLANIKKKFKPFDSIEMSDMILSKGVR